MKVLHVVGCYPPETFFTGPPEQLHRVVREMRGIGVDARVVTTDCDGPGRRIDVPTGRWTEHEGVPVFYGRRLPGTLDLSWEAYRELASSAAWADVVHVTAIFSWVSLAVARVARRVRVPVIISPRGSLSPQALAFSSGKKAVYRRAGGARAFREAAAFHATAAKERDDIRASVPGAAVGIVPNGVTIPSEADLARWTAGPPARPYVLFLGRVHAAKNVPVLVEAWSRVAGANPGAKLVLAGRDDRGYFAEVRRRIDEVGVASSVEMPGSVSGEAKARLLAGATCLVLPSTTENFGNVVAEALAHATPVVASTGTPWSGLVERGCGWWVAPEAPALAGAIGEALHATPDARRESGRRGRAWMTESFAWPIVARRMVALYEGVKAGKSLVGDAGLEPTTSCV